MGFGAMFAWLLLLNYLRDNDEMNVMNATLSKAGPDIFFFVIGVMPVFIAFALLC